MTKRRDMLLPALRLELIKYSRQLVAKSLLNGQIIMDNQNQAVQTAIFDLIRPLHPHNVDFQQILLLRELRILCGWPELQRDEGFENSELILGESFPYEWFTTIDAMPINHLQVQLFMPSSMATTETELAGLGVRVVDCASVHFSEFAFHAPRHTCVAFVIGLHCVRANLVQECEALEQAYVQACMRGSVQFAIVLSQIDVWEQHGGGGGFAELRELVQHMIGALGEGGRIPIKLAVVDALDPCSARVCLQELNLQRCDRAFRCEFLPQGIAPHHDAQLSEILGKTVVWSRSVFTGIGVRFNNKKLEWTPPLYSLVSQTTKQQILTVYLCSKRKECILLFPLPSVLLAHIVSYFATFE